MTGTCPACNAPQDAGLLCHTCTTRLERDLGDVAAIVADLDITLSKQAKIGNASGPGGLARERTPLNVGAMNVADDLQNTLTTWARDVALCGNGCSHHGKPTVHAAKVLLRNIDAIRRHPAVNELVDEITDAIRQARRIVDRPADRQFFGPCLFEMDDVTCHEDMYARPEATWVTCRVCGTTHEVAERRRWLIRQAEDMLFTVPEASQMLGDVGGIKVTQASIRGYLHRGRLAYRPGGKRIRLGDLLAVVMDDSERRTA